MNLTFLQFSFTNISLFDGHIKLIYRINASQFMLLRRTRSHVNITSRRKCPVFCCCRKLINFAICIWIIQNNIFIFLNPFLCCLILL